MENIEELKALKQENSKLKLEERLRKSLASELERQKSLVQQAKVEADAQRDKLQIASEQLSKYLSPQICEKIFSGVEFSAKSARKKLTIFFSDIVGFTTLSEQMEAEDLSNFLNFYLTNMCDIALKYGGTIDKFIGDSIMIFFGDPDTKGAREDAIGCCNMAMEMLTFLESNQQHFQDMYNFPEKLDIRIGIHNGLCNVGNFGSAQRLDYTAIGRAVNVASRLEQAAPKNSILISSAVRNLVKNNFETSAPTEVKAKGIDKPIASYVVIRQGSSKTKLIKELDGFKLEYDPKKIDKKKLLKIIEELEN
jgi:class 3 adenylate cyclase